LQKGEGPPRVGTGGVWQKTFLEVLRYERKAKAEKSRGGTDANAGNLTSADRVTQTKEGRITEQKPRRGQLYGELHSQKKKKCSGSEAINSKRG